MILSRQDSFIVRTNRSAYAFRLGDRGGKQRVPVTDKVALPFDKSINRIADVPRDLAHPQTIRHTGYSRDLNPAC